MYFEKIPHENREIIMLLLMTSLAKERETTVKKFLCYVCHIGKFMKWLYEMENHVMNCYSPSVGIVVNVFVRRQNVKPYFSHTNW